MKKSKQKPDDFIELMSLTDVCNYTLMSKSSLDKRSRDPDDPFPAPEWLNKTRVWRASVIRQYVYDTITSVPPAHPRRAEKPSDDMDSLKFGAGGKG